LLHPLISHIGLQPRDQDKGHAVISNVQHDYVLTSHHTPDGYLELCQPSLINKIVTACGLQDQSSTHQTPSTVILTADTLGPPREHSWNYRSIIGMSNYLASSTRPDIAFAVHQCARFTTAPCRVHELVIRCVLRYLKGTSTKGYILKPTSDRNLNCFIDADFAGLLLACCFRKFFTNNF